MVESKPDTLKQGSISNFFKPKSSQPPAKRPSLEILTIDDSSDEDDSARSNIPPPPKKVKLETSATINSTSASSTTGQAASIFSTAGPSSSTSLRRIPAPRKASNPKIKKWAYDVNSTDPVPSRSSLSQEEMTKRREIIASKLLDKSLLQRRTAYLQEDHYLAANAEASGSRSPPVGAPLFNPAEDDEEDDSSCGHADRDEEEEPVKGKGKGKARSKGKEKEVEPVANRFSKYASKGATTRTSTTSSKGVKYTPLEQQVLALKKANPGVVLAIEVGYKYRFFEEDAITASRILGIAQFRSKSMLTASIPTHRLHIHIKRLINAGEKVGVVRQKETAALKKIGDNRSAPFTRGLQGVYTSATFIDELNIDPAENLGHRAPTVLCLVEEASGKDQKVTIGIIAVTPSTGEVIYDEFQDGLMRSELETRMLHLQPSELVLQEKLSKQTESMVQYLIGQHDAGVPGFKCRIDRIKKQLKLSAAVSYLSEFLLKGDAKSEAKTGGPSEIVIDDDDEDDADNDVSSAIKSDPSTVLDLPRRALVALAALIEYMKTFELDMLFLHKGNFSSFSGRATLSLNGNTLANLEVLLNSTDFKQQGSLISVLDHCKTAFGKRKLRQWLTRPLLSIAAVTERLDAVEEIATNPSAASLTLSKLREVLRGLPDLDRGLVRIQVGTAKPVELVRVLQAFERVGNTFEVVRPEDEAAGAATPRQTVKSALLKRIVESLPMVKKDVAAFLARLNVVKAREGKKEEMFSDLPEQVEDCGDCLAAVEAELHELLLECRKLLKKPGLNFAKVGEEEFLIEVRVGESAKTVPPDWVKINSTRAVYRYRSPAIQAKMEELAQCKERLAAAAEVAYTEFLEEVSSCYESLRACVSNLAQADCLFSFAITALEPGYTRPSLSSEPGFIEIENGRHPIIEVVSPQPFVANSLKLGGGSPKQMILTGLNMGGKSSFSRSIALIALMAQVGCYVPADSCTTSLFDNILTRMGASDEIARGRSTFMVEMSECSEILKLATPRSLIILDELGRGTSTSDGQAIASAVLQHIVTSVGSSTIFVTHYPSLADVAKRYPESVSLNQMACLETPRSDGFVDIVFLYKLVEGLASRSHGLNVARLAELPESVLSKALEKSQELEAITEGRLLHRRAHRLSQILQMMSKASSSSNRQHLLEACFAALS